MLNGGAAFNTVMMRRGRLGRRKEEECSKRRVGWLVGNGKGAEVVKHKSAENTKEKRVGGRDGEWKCGGVSAWDMD